MKSTIKHLSILILTFLFMVSLIACDPVDTPPDDDKDPIGWNGESITYEPDDIAELNASIPQGYAIVNPDNPEQAIIKSISPELDNYGGISTGILSLNFNYAVIFQMDIVSVYSEYIVKLFVEGEKDSFYVLSDESTTGFISINVVDSMLSDKYRDRGTLPDPGYATGWKYDNQTKNCYFYIMPKGPDGELRTANLVVNSISITNFNAPAITDVFVSHELAEDGTISQLKNSTPLQLVATVTPNDVHDNSVIWKSDNEAIATVSETGLVSFVGVGKTEVYAISVIDQSKRGSIIINVLSGFENTAVIQTYFNGMQANPNGVDVDSTLFNDIFNTSWTTTELMRQQLKYAEESESIDALSPRLIGHQLLVENYFDASSPADLGDANDHLNNNQASFEVSFAGNNQNYQTSASGTLIRLVDDKVFKSTFTGLSDIKAAIAYAHKNNDSFIKRPSYLEKGIFIWSNGTVTKYEVMVKSLGLLRYYEASDFLDTDLWKDGDTQILAAGSVRDNLDGTITIKEENMTKYPYGGLVSELFTVSGDKDIEIVFNVTGTNPSRVLWDVRILYFVDGSKRGNPLKLQSSNQTGEFTLSFTPVETEFMIYLIANGSDIGQIAEGAEIKLSYLKIQVIE